MWDQSLQMKWRISILENRLFVLPELSSVLPFNYFFAMTLISHLEAIESGQDVADEMKDYVRAKFPIDLKNTTSYTLRSAVRCQFAQPAEANNNGIRSSRRKTFVSLNAAFEERGTLPKITNVSSLASSDDVKFSSSLINYRRSQPSRFFYLLPVHSQLKLINQLKRPHTDWPSYHEIAREINVPFDKVKGWLNAIKNRVYKVSDIEKVPQSKVDILNDEFSLSETLSEDRLLLLSFILKINERVIQQFFDSKKDCKKTLRPRPTAVSASKKSLNAAAFGNFLVPCLRLTRCSIPPEKPTYFSDTGRRRIFTKEQLTILRDIFCRQESLDREETDRIAQQLGASVTSTDVGNWFAKARYRKKLSEKLLKTPVKSEPRSTRSHEKDEVLSSPEINELCSSHSPEKRRALDNVEILPRCGNQPLRPGPISVAMQNALFEEYKKSPVLTAGRRNTLQTTFGIRSSRIHVFFNKLSALLRGKTENDVTKLLTSYPGAFLSKIAAEYRRNRYVSVMRAQKLAKQWGSSRRIVIDWFSNARLYELLSGNRFHPIAKPLARSALVRENQREKVVEPVCFSEAKQSSSANAVSCRAASTGFGNGRVTSKKKAGLRRKPVIHYDTTVREILFNAFKQSSALSPSSLSRVCSASKLSTTQVCVWFQRTRRKLTSIGSEKFLFQSDHRNLYLTPEQIAVLEEEFQKHPYENEKIKEVLADQLKVNRGTIQTWFCNRRNYDLIVFGLPELVKVKKDKYFSGAPNESTEDKMNTSNSVPAPQNFKIRLLQLKDIPLNDSNQDFHSSVDSGSDLLGMTAVKEELLPEEPDSPVEMDTSSADVSLPENSDVICKTEGDFEKRANGSMQFSEILEQELMLAYNLESSADDGTRLPRYPSVANDCNAVSQPDLRDVPKVCSLNAPLVEEPHYFGVELAVISPAKNSSTEKTVAICEAAIALLEDLSVVKPLCPVSKPSVDDLEVCQTVAVTPEEFPDGSQVLPDVSKSLSDHFVACETTIVKPQKLGDGFNLLHDTSVPLVTPMNVCNEVAAEALPNASESEEVSDSSDPADVPKNVEALPDISKPYADHLEVSNSVAATPKELPDSSKPLTDASIPLVNHLEVTNSVATSAGKLPDSLKPLPDICMPLPDHLEVSNSVTTATVDFPVSSEALRGTSIPMADHLEISSSVAVTPEELLGSLKPLPDTSMPLANHLDVSNCVPATPNELPHSLDLLPDTFKPLGDHLGVLNAVAATFNELPNCLDLASNVSEPLVDHKYALTNGCGSPIEEESACLVTESPNFPENVNEQQSRPSESKTKPLLNALQRETLLQEYKKSPFLSAPKAQMLASELNLPVTRIKLWFRKRRCKNAKWLASEKLVDEKFKQPQSSQSFSPFQLFVLEREFGENSVLTTARLTHLCQKLKTARRLIIAWFQDRHRVEAAKM